MNDERDRPSGEERPEVGGVAEEAAELFSALAGWAKEQRTHAGDTAGAAAQAASAAARTIDEHVATGSAECRYCPVCQAIHLVRSTSPEVRAHLAAAASSLAQAAAAVLATDVPGKGREPGVQRIDLDDEGDPTR